MLGNYHSPDFGSSFCSVVAHSPTVALQTESGTKGWTKELETDITHHHKLSVFIIEACMEEIKIDKLNKDISQAIVK